MRTKNCLALLAALAISAFLFADNTLTSVVPAYYTQQIYLFKKLIKKYPRLLQDKSIKSWAAYLEYVLYHNSHTAPKQKKLLTLQEYARFSELYTAALKLKKHAASSFSAAFSTVSTPLLVPHNQEQKQELTLCSTNASWPRTYTVTYRPRYGPADLSIEGQEKDKSILFKTFVNEVRTQHRDLTRHNKYDDTYEIISIQANNYDTQEKDEEEWIPDAMSAYDDIKYDRGALPTVRQTIEELPASTLIDLTYEMRDSHLIGAYTELAKRFTKTNNPYLHKQQLWLERKIIKIYKSRKGIRGFFRRLYTDKLSTENELQLFDLYERICDQRKAVADMKHTISALQNTKRLNPNAQAAFKEYYTRLTTDPMLKYRISRNQRHFVLRNTARIIHRDVVNTLNTYSTKLYPTKAEEDSVLSLKRYLDTNERYLHKLINPKEPTSCYHTIVQQVTAIQHKRESLDTFEKHTGIEQECIRTLERNWDIRSSKSIQI